MTQQPPNRKSSTQEPKRRTSDKRPGNLGRGQGSDHLMEVFDGVWCMGSPPTIGGGEQPQILRILKIGWLVFWMGFVGKWFHPLKCRDFRKGTSCWRQKRNTSTINSCITELRSRWMNFPHENPSATGCFFCSLGQFGSGSQGAHKVSDPLGGSGIHHLTTKNFCGEFCTKKSRSDIWIFFIDSYILSYSCTVLNSHTGKSGKLFCIPVSIHQLAATWHCQGVKPDATAAALRLVDTVGCRPTPFLKRGNGSEDNSDIAATWLVK